MHWNRIEDKRSQPRAAAGARIESLECRMLMSTATLRPIRVALEPLVLTGSAVDETDYVARFTGGSTDWTQTATLPTATIGWGDGTVQKEHVSVSGQNASTLQVLPFVAHPYTKPGTYTIHVTL